MSDREELFERLSEEEENAEQVSVRTNEESGTVEVELEDTAVELDPEEARSFAENLEEYAKDEGWYHAGQTKPLIEKIEDSADAVE